jgi:hypothetical protein
MAVGPVNRRRQTQGHIQCRIDVIQAPETLGGRYCTSVRPGRWDNFAKAGVA